MVAAIKPMRPQQRAGVHEGRVRNVIFWCCGRSTWRDIPMASVRTPLYNRSFAGAGWRRGASCRAGHSHGVGADVTLDVLVHQHGACIIRPKAVPGRSPRRTVPQDTCFCRYQRLPVGALTAGEVQTTACGQTAVGLIWVNAMADAAMIRLIQPFCEEGALANIPPRAIAEPICFSPYLTAPTLGRRFFNKIRSVGEWQALRQLAANYLAFVLARSGLAARY